MTDSPRRAVDHSGGAALIGVDVGTSSVRAIAFDERGRRLAAAARPTPTKIVETGGEFDPDAIFSTVLAALAEVGEGSPAGRWRELRSRASARAAS